MDIINALLIMGIILGVPVFGGIGIVKLWEILDNMKGEKE